MVDFLKEAGMIISIIEPIPKSEENVVSLSRAVKVNSSIVKAEKISNISNATIVDHETAELLENKLKKTLEEMLWDYNHMRWFRAYRQLQDAGTDNKTAVEAITHKDYREDRLTTITWAEKHRICLELLKICTPARDIDDRASSQNVLGI
ncbi:hypothetical protein C1646_777874 [Rhizophagus diaphanus]|nr:hypothetical protein C1646_777874 [Rhizophagus diaphanus] [Rhizophagus sp. MUCL 43196]